MSGRRGKRDSEQTSFLLIGWLLEARPRLPAKCHPRFVFSYHVFLADAAFNISIFKRVFNRTSVGDTV